MSTISRLEASAALGTFLKLPVVETVELMAIAGFNLVVIDLEHSPMSMESAARMLAISRPLGLESLVRIPSHGYEWIQRSLDAGAGGILVPHVDTAEQAESAVAAARFPPDGKRGFGPTTRAGNWAVSRESPYRRNAEEAAVVVQIESSEGVENIDAILRSGVDSVFVGPADLAAALGVEPGSSELTAACEKVLTASQSLDVPCGIAAGGGPQAKRLLDVGYAYVVVGNDATMLGASARSLVDDVRG